MAHVDEQPGPGETYWTDGWSGYPAARERLFATLESTRVRNPVCLSGDIHAFLAAKLNRRRSRIPLARRLLRNSSPRRSARRACP